MSLEAALASLVSNPGIQQNIDEYNARVRSVSSFFAGLGDALNWACLYPGCGRDLRAALTIDTGDADGWSYFWGSVTGIAGSLAAPRPTATPVVPTPAPTSGATFGGDIINASRGTLNCASCAFTLDHMLGGGYPASAVRRILSNAELNALGYWTKMSGPGDIVITMTGFGHGSRGIIAAWDKAGNFAPHVFNVINQRGSIVFLESQLGGGVELVPDAYDWAFDVFRLLRTK